MPPDSHCGHWNVAASNYWMFLHPTIGCRSTSWITSNYWILALTDQEMYSDEERNLKQVFDTVITIVSAKAKAVDNPWL